MAREGSENNVNRGANDKFYVSTSPGSLPKGGGHVRIGPQGLASVQSRCRLNAIRLSAGDAK
jgi:hypothetical protein